MDGYIPDIRNRNDSRVNSRGDVEELFRSHAPAARRLAYLLVSDIDLAEDIVGDCFVRLCGRVGGLSGVLDVPAYLRRMVVNESRSQLRRRRVRRRRAHEVPHACGPGGAGDAVAPDDVGRLADRQLLRAALARLPHRQRTAVVLRYYLDLSESDTAETMGCSVGTVKTLASRGRAALAPQLTDPRRPPAAAPPVGKELL